MDNKLNLVVNFLGVDKLSGSMKNIMMSGKSGRIALRGMKDEARLLERELAGVRKEIANGTGNMTSLINRERQLAAAVSSANGQLAEQGRRLATVQKIQSRAGAVRSAAGNAGTAASIGITAPLLYYAQQSKDAFFESQDAIAQVDASLTSMGRRAEFTAGQLALIARSEMKKSLYDDDDILRNVTSTMLTFGKVQGPTFSRAQAAAIDLSVKFKKDLAGSAVMVGKALQDPIKGVSALSRVGVSFDASQKAMIKSMVKSGNVAGAQKLILAELEKQVAGSAEAARKANPGAAAKQDLDEMQETMGQNLLPVMMKVTTAVGSLAGMFNKLSPSTQQFIVYALLGAAALGPLLMGVAGLAATIGFLAGPIGLLTTGLGAVFGAMKGVHAVGLAVNAFKMLRFAVFALARGVMQAGLMMLANPVVLAITVIVAALAFAGYMIYTHWGTIKAAFYSGIAMLSQAWGTIKATFAAGVAYIAAIPGRMAAFGRNIIMGLANGIASAPGAVWNALKNVVMGGINKIKNFLGIKSPSRLFMSIGGYMTEGMAIGLDGGRSKAVGAAGRLATSVAAAGALSMAPAGATGVQRGVAAPAGVSQAGPVYHISVNVYGAQGQDADQLAEKVIAKLNKVAGINARSAYSDGE